MWEAKGGPGLAPAAPGEVLSSWRNRKDSKRLEGGGVTDRDKGGIATLEGVEREEELLFCISGEMFGFKTQYRAEMCSTMLGLVFNMFQSMA